MLDPVFIKISEDLELAGLKWNPEIGDEVSYRKSKDKVSVLVDPQGMGPQELRQTYLWLPTLEQMIIQVEARSTILEHTGLELSENKMAYRTVLKSPVCEVEGRAISMRASMGLALRNLLLSTSPTAVN